MARDRGNRHRGRGGHRSARRAHVAEEQAIVRAQRDRDRIAQERARIRDTQERIRQEMLGRSRVEFGALRNNMLQSSMRDHLGITDEERRRILAQGGPVLQEIQRRVWDQRAPIIEEARARMQAQRVPAVEEMRGRLMVELGRAGVMPLLDIVAGGDFSINDTQLATWGQRNTALCNDQDTQSFCFLERFAVNDLHIQELLSGPMTHHTLERFQAGSLSQGNCDITDRVLASLAKACPKLRQVRLLGACKLTDMGLAGLLEFCRRIELIEISGGEQQSGLIAAPGHLGRFKNTRHDRKWCRALLSLAFYNQTNLDLESCKQLTRNLLGLEVLFGNTASNDRHRMMNGEVTQVIQVDGILVDVEQLGSAQQDPGEDGHQDDHMEDVISRGLDGMTLDDSRDVVME